MPDLFPGTDADRDDDTAETIPLRTGHDPPAEQEEEGADAGHLQQQNGESKEVSE